MSKSKYLPVSTDARSATPTQLSDITPSSSGASPPNTQWTPDYSDESPIDGPDEALELRKLRQDPEKRREDTLSRKDERVSAAESGVVVVEEEGEEEEEPKRMGRTSTWSKSYTRDEERAVLRKFDKRLVLFLALLYMLSFLDRSSTFPVVTDCIASY